jgi:hypothetical protein
LLRCEIDLDFCAVQYKLGCTGELRRGIQADLKRGAPGKAKDTMKGFEDMQKFGKVNAEATMRTLGTVQKSVQTIAVEMADYSKKAFEDGAAATEKLMGAKSIEKAIEVQTDYFKSAYEGFMSQTAKLGELYTGLAQEAYKPFESYVSKAAAAK